ncbi:MAG: phosphodiesterase [Pseudomonadota bacterium]
MLIAHLSDPHLRPEGRLYKGLVDSNAMFEAALDALLALRPRPDLVLIGGDLVDEGEAGEYAQARRALARLPMPLLAIPGNHDDREGFRRGVTLAEPAAEAGPLHVDSGARWPVRVLGLDVTVPGAHHGEADAAALAWLSARLAEDRTRPTLLLMHQPPVETGVECIDAYMCRGGAPLAAVLEGASNLERVLCGHVHRFFQARFGGTLLTACPSTATSIALRLEPGAEGVSFLEPPAFLLHAWQEGRPMVTHWVPVGRFPGPFAFY